MSLAIHVGLKRDDFSLRIDIDVDAGATLGLTGDIGTGKSSVLQLVAGRLRAFDGMMAWDAQVWDEPTTGVFVDRRPVTFQSQLFQSDLSEERSGVENVIDAILRHTPTSRGAETSARTMLANLGVQDHVIDRLPWTFSGAESQRVGLAVALAPRPDVVLLDEPTSALDKRTRAAVTEFLEQWLAHFDGITLIASTNRELLDRLCDATVDLGAT